MEFVQRLEATARRIEDHLRALLDESGLAAEGRLGGAMRHAVLGGGKRFRPFLVIESAALFGVEERAVLDAAAAIECVHCYSLVHDDLPCMDDDDLRRGQPTVHKAYDEWTAVLSGDALLTLAFQILARPTTDRDANIRSELVLALATAAGARGMVDGQMMDLQAEKLDTPAHPTIEHVRHLQALKTGALIACACEAGAILGRATAIERAALKRYGEHHGFAFQIADDLLDAEGDIETVGKATGKDDARGKATLVSLLDVEDARACLEKEEQEAVESLHPFGGRAATLIEAARFTAQRVR
ncbi:MAG: polyprenyl synthetase family protein [Hyphomicrobium sp.]